MRSVTIIAPSLVLAVFLSQVPCSAQDDDGGPPPDTPSNLVVSGEFTTMGTERSVILTWQDNSDADAGFLVEASSNGLNGWTPIAYTPNNYITLHSNSNMAVVLGYYSGLTAGGVKYFRVRAKYVGDEGALFYFYSNVASVHMPAAPTCTSQKKLSPVPDFTAHVGFPIDLWPVFNVNESCLWNPPGSGGPDYIYCVVSGPTGLTIDFNGGLVSYTPVGLPAVQPVTLGFVKSGDPCTVAKAVATTSFTMTIDNNTFMSPVFRDYRSEPSVIAVKGHAWENFASYGLFSSALCATYDSVTCPLTQEAPYSTTPVSYPEDALASWNVAPYHDGSRRLLSMIVQSPTKANTSVYNPVIVDRSAFNPFWPKRLPNASTRGALAVDLTGDGRDEIIASSRSTQGGPYVWDTSGALDWQAQCGLVQESEVAVGDVDGDGINDVVTACQNAVKVFRGTTGALIASVTVAYPKTFMASPTLADLDGDRDLEILINLSTGSASPAETHAYKYNNSATLVEYSTDWPKTLAGIHAGQPAVADLNNDTHLDVVVNNYDYLYAWSSDPAHPLAWPAPYSRVAIPSPLRPLAYKTTAGEDTMTFTQPSIADLDGNGIVDIIVLGQNIIDPSTGTYLRCLNGGVCTNASTAIPAALGMTAAIGEFIASSPGPEILLGGYVFASGAGSGGAPLRVLAGGVSQGVSTIVDAGVDANHQSETYALMGTMDQSQFVANISAFESDGTVDGDYPKALYGNAGCGSAPQLGDFDGDGNRDVLVEITDASYGAIVALYKTSVSSPFDAANNPWPMFGHDPQRTGHNTCRQQRSSCTADPQCCSARCNAGACQ